MILYRDLDIFTAKVDAVIIPVNCVGVMGAGVAHQAVAHFGKDMLLEYRRACRDGLAPGRLSHWRAVDGRRVIFAPTKRHWRDGSNLADVAATIHALPDAMRAAYACTAAVPALGAGLGGMRWLDVKPLFESMLDLDERLYLLAPPK